MATSRAFLRSSRSNNLAQDFASVVKKGASDAVDSLAGNHDKRRRRSPEESADALFLSPDFPGVNDLFGSGRCGNESDLSVDDDECIGSGGQSLFDEPSVDAFGDLQLGGGGGGGGRGLGSSAPNSPRLSLLTGIGISSSSPAPAPALNLARSGSVFDQLAGHGHRHHGSVGVPSSPFTANFLGGLDALPALDATALSSGGSVTSATHPFDFSSDGFFSSSAAPAPASSSSVMAGGRGATTTTTTTTRVPSKVKREQAHRIVEQETRPDLQSLRATANKRPSPSSARQTALTKVDAASDVDADDDADEREFEARLAQATTRGDTAAIRHIKNGREKVRRAKMCNKFQELHDVLNITNKMMALSMSSGGGDHHHHCNTPDALATVAAVVAAREASAAVSAKVAESNAAAAHAALRGGSVAAVTKALGGGAAGGSGDKNSSKAKFRKAQVLHDAIQTIKDMQAQIEALAQQNAALQSQQSAL
jgi:hypothetical protein